MEGSGLRHCYKAQDSLRGFPSNAAFQIFPIDETNHPVETKIISLGNKGYISFNLTSCDNNYYYLEDSNICIHSCY